MQDLQWSLDAAADSRRAVAAVLAAEEEKSEAARRGEAAAVTRAEAAERQITSEQSATRATQIELTRREDELTASVARATLLTADLETRRAECASLHKSVAEAEFSIERQSRKHAREVDAIVRDKFLTMVRGCESSLSIYDNTVILFTLVYEDFYDSLERSSPDWEDIRSSLCERTCRLDWNPV